MEALPPPKSGCSILPTTRHLRAGVLCERPRPALCLHEHGWTFPREVLEALEGCDDVPLPARYGFWAVPEGVAVEVVARGTGSGVRCTIETHLEEQGVPAQELHVVEHPDALRHPMPLRCDLKEALFAMPSAQHVPSG